MSSWQHECVHACCVDWKSSHPKKHQRNISNGLTSSMLTICEVLRSHPEAAAENTNPVVNSFVQNNLFVYDIRQALEEACACKGTFGNWIVEARKVFLSRNVPATPIEKSSLYGDNNGSNILMDPWQHKPFVNVKQEQHTMNDTRDKQRGESHLRDEHVI